VIAWLTRWYELGDAAVNRVEPANAALGQPNMNAKTLHVRTECSIFQASIGAGFQWRAPRSVQATAQIGRGPKGHALCGAHSPRVDEPGEGRRSEQRLHQLIRTLASTATASVLVSSPNACGIRSAVVVLVRRHEGARERLLIRISLLVFSSIAARSTSAFPHAVRSSMADAGVRSINRLSR
jgi:hypothetical protein